MYNLKTKGMYSNLDSSVNIRLKVLCSNVDLSINPEILRLVICCKGLSY